MWVLGLLPFLFFVAACRVVIARAGPSLARRDAIITSALLTSAWLVLGTELLSLLHIVSFWPLLAWWTLPFPLLILFGRGARFPLALNPPHDRVLAGIIAACAAILLITLIVAAITAPNNIDALTYHLPRQVYWLQQKHLGIFPTNDLRMLVLPPFAEYAGLNLMILSGGDRWVNLIQWFAFGLTALTASCLARDLQCSARMQVISALLVLTIPTAALQAMNPKNDVVAAFFLCAMALQALEISRVQTHLWLHVIFFGVASGLLVLTKSTGLLFGVPVAAWAGVMLIRRCPIWRTSRYTAIVAAAVLFINLGHWIRMYQGFGSLLGPPLKTWSAPVVNIIHTPQALISNLLRNTGMHLGTSIKPIDASLVGGMKQLHELIQIDLNDPRTTYKASGPFTLSGNFVDEDVAKAPFHVVLGIAAFCFIICSLRRRHWTITAFALAPYLGFVLFCYALAWQEWHSRLHIPVLCLLVPISVYSFPSRASPVLFGVVVAAFLLSAYSTLCNQAKPVLGPYSVLASKPLRSQVIPHDAAEGLRSLRVICQRDNPKIIFIYTHHCCEYALLKLLLRTKGRPRFFKMNAQYGRDLRPGILTVDIVIAWYDVPSKSFPAFYRDFSPISENGPVIIFRRNRSVDVPASTSTTRPANPP